MVADLSAVTLVNEISLEPAAPWPNNGTPYDVASAWMDNDAATEELHRLKSTGQLSISHIHYLA